MVLVLAVLEVTNCLVFWRSKGAGARVVMEGVSGNSGGSRGIVSGSSGVVLVFGLSSGVCWWASSGAKEDRVPAPEVVDWIAGVSGF